MDELSEEEKKDAPKTGDCNKRRRLTVKKEEWSEERKSSFIRHI